MTFKLPDDIFDNLRELSSDRCADYRAEEETLESLADTYIRITSSGVPDAATREKIRTLLNKIDGIDQSVKNYVFDDWKENEARLRYLLNVNFDELSPRQFFVVGLMELIEGSYSITVFAKGKGANEATGCAQALVRSIVRAADTYIEQETDCADDVRRAAQSNAKKMKSTLDMELRRAKELANARVW